jgi:hypothetical protein
MVRGLTADELLDVWERGQQRTPIEQALLMLAPCAAIEPDALAALRIGRRDELLLHARRQTFGEALAGWAECPECHERLEFITSIGDLLRAASGDARAVPGSAPDHFDAHVGGLDVTMRAPNSLDMLALGACPAVDTARRLLVERCVASVRRGDTALAVSDLGEDLVALLAAEASAYDPFAEMLLDMCCPACETRWQALFDSGLFFWQELATQARRLLREVHLLARAYGWRETDILALSARRRQSYIELIEGG